MIDSAWQMAQVAIAEQSVLLICDAFEQVSIVTDDNQCSRPAVEQVFDGREHVGVEVVGWLVENQNVRLAKEQSQELQASALATR